jgi:hypothetical protein
LRAAANFSLLKVILPSRVSSNPAWAGEPSSPTASETAWSSWPPMEVTAYSPRSAAVLPWALLV